MRVGLKSKRCLKILFSPLDKDKNKEKKEELDEEIIKVYDGYNSLRKRLFRTVTVSKNATKDELLHASMKAFVVTQVHKRNNSNLSN